MTGSDLLALEKQTKVLEVNPAFDTIYCLYLWGVPVITETQGHALGWARP